MAEKRIGSRVFRYDRLPVSRSLSLAVRVAKVLGSAGHLMEAIVEKDEAKRDAAVVSALPSFVTQLDADEAMSLVTEVVSTCSVDGDRIADVDGFIDDLGELLKVFFWALSVEFGSFFGDKPGPKAARAARA